MFADVQLGPFAKAAYSQDRETGIGIVIESADGKGDLPQEIGVLNGQALTLEHLRKWFAPVSELEWHSYDDDQLRPIVHERRLVARQNGLALALKVPVTTERDSTAGEALIQSWIKANLS